MTDHGYLGVALRWWWLIIAVTALTLVATAYFLAGQPEVYESSATFVVKPRDTDAEELVRAIDTLSRRVEINSTYADISESKLIRRRAVEALSLGEGERSGLRVSSRVVTGTNILEITGYASNPDLAQAFTGAVAVATLSYIGDLGDIFTLQSLDPPSSSGKPTSPNTRNTMVLGGVLGLGLGYGLALGADRVWSRRRKRDPVVAPPDEPASDHLGDAETVLVSASGPPDGVEETDPNESHADIAVGSPPATDDAIHAADRRRFEKSVSQAMQRAHSGSEKGPTVAVYAVSGHWSKDNDTLQVVTTQADEWLSAEDVFCRLNDRELAVMILRAEPGDVEARAEQYRTAISDLLEKDGSNGVSVDFGLAGVPGDVASTEGGAGVDQIITAAHYDLITRQ
jgi:capsular polysaccharide biosynthesis protein/GGDEF domain-containing protein